nr:NTP transferase domain-containing protein [Kordiimonas gwangyangensis]
MPKQDIAVVVLAAGKGTRMKSKLHKVLHAIGGQPMLHHLLASVESLSPAKTVIVVGAEREQVEAASRIAKSLRNRNNWAQAMLS